MKLAARTVALNRRGQRLVFDYDGRFYRMAFYFPKVVEGKVEGEHRVATIKSSLKDALITVFGEACELTDCKQDPLTVESYMRATAWGRELP